MLSLVNNAKNRLSLTIGDVIPGVKPDLDILSSIATLILNTTLENFVNPLSFAFGKRLIALTDKHSYKPLSPKNNIFNVGYMENKHHQIDGIPQNKYKLSEIVDSRCLF